MGSTATSILLKNNRLERNATASSTCRHNQLLFQVKHHSSTFAEIGMGERAFFSVDLINSWAPIPASGWMVSKAVSVQPSTLGRLPAIVDDVRSVASR